MRDSRRRWRIIRLADVNDLGLSRSWRARLLTITNRLRALLWWRIALLKLDNLWLLWHKVVFHLNRLLSRWRVAELFSVADRFGWQDRWIVWLLEIDDLRFLFDMARLEARLFMVLKDLLVFFMANFFESAVIFNRGFNLFDMRGCLLLITPILLSIASR